MFTQLGKFVHGYRKKAKWIRYPQEQSTKYYLGPRV